MEKKVDYSHLYELQDAVLDIVFSLNHGFYLTGGTALHRFYYGLRYSDDLDFFTNNDALFAESINEILEAFEANNHTYMKVVQSKDFQRVIFEGELQIDFVNDRTYRDGKSVLFGNYRVDNINNILTNKLGAIMDRDEEKDVFDLVSIAHNENICWDDALSIANKKSPIDRLALMQRLRTFPLGWLSNIKEIKHIEITADTIERICADIMPK